MSTWALTITRNLAINALRRRRATPVAPGDLDFVNLVSRDAAPEDVVANADEAAPAWAALAEERLLCESDSYRRYRDVVRWRCAPAIW